MFLCEGENGAAEEVFVFVTCFSVREKWSSGGGFEASS